LGYRGGAPSWVYKQQMAIQQSSHDSYVRRLEEKIRKLEEEKRELLHKVDELEKENNSLKLKNLVNKP